MARTASSLLQTLRCLVPPYFELDHDVVSLGFFYPTRRGGMQDQYLNYLSPLFPIGRRFDTTVRSPKSHRMGLDSQVKDWHSDVFTHYFKDDSSCKMHGCWMTVWSNVAPTELENGRIIQPYEVVLWRNEHLRHRSPALSWWQTRRRWFIRQGFYPDTFQETNGMLVPRLYEKVGVT